MRIAVAAVLVLLAPSASADEGWVGGGEWSACYDSNLGNAPRYETPEGSAFMEGALQLDRNLPIGEYVGVLARASLRVQGYARENGLANAKEGGLLRVSVKPGSGLFTPTFVLWASAAHWNWASALRDSDELRAGAAWLQHLNTQFTLRLSANASDREARSRPFDLRSRSAALDLDWQPQPRLALHAGYMVIDGDTVSTTEPDKDIAAFAKVRQPDDAFDGAPQRIVYRFAARTQAGTLGANYALAHDLSLDTQLLYVATRAEDDDLRYARWIGTAGILWRW